MRILQVLHWFLPQHTTGTEVYTHALARALAARHVVAVFCGEDQGVAPGLHEWDDSYDGLPVHRVQENVPTRQLVHKALARICNPRVEDSFCRYLDRFQPDVVHIQHLFKLSGGLIAIAHRRGIPVVVTLHDYWFLCHNGQLVWPGMQPCPGPAGGWRCPGCAELPLSVGARWALSPLLWPFFLHRTRYLRRCLERADAIISPSAYLAARFVQQGFSAERIMVSANGLDMAWAKAVIHEPASGVRFGFIGTLAPHKGVHGLLEAFRGLGDQATLHIYGGAGHDSSYAAALQERDDDQVFFHGPFRREALAQVLSGIDVLVVPSLWPENAPVTIQEARAAGVPVIGADIGGIPELIRNGQAGWLVPPGDMAALRERMAALVRDPARIDAFRARILPPKGITQQARELETLYAEVGIRLSGLKRHS